MCTPHIHIFRMRTVHRISSEFHTVHTTKEPVFEMKSAFLCSPMDSASLLFFSFLYFNFIFSLSFSHFKYKFRRKIFFLFIRSNLYLFSHTVTVISYSVEQSVFILPFLSHSIKNFNNLNKFSFRKFKTDEKKNWINASNSPAWSPFNVGYESISMLRIKNKPKIMWNFELFAITFSLNEK